MFAFFLPLLIQGQGCPAPPQSIPVIVTSVTGQALGGKAQPASPERFEVGDFVYSGHGIVETSRDARFRDLVLDQAFGLRHRCGNIVTGFSGWNARDLGLGRWSVQVEKHLGTYERSPGSSAASDKGARPILASYVPGATWPVYSEKGSFFLGLMHPEDGSSETVIVAFGDVPRPSPAAIMARLPIKFDTINLVPELHGPDSFVHISFLQDDRFTHVVLRLERSVTTDSYKKVYGR